MCIRDRICSVDIRFGLRSEITARLAIGISLPESDRHLYGHFPSMSKATYVNADVHATKAGPDFVSAENISLL